MLETVILCGGAQTPRRPRKTLRLAVHGAAANRLRIGRWFSSVETESSRQKHIAQEFTRLEKEILRPLYAVVDRWKKIAGIKLVTQGKNWLIDFEPDPKV